MNEQHQLNIRGSYTANLLGNIKSHLAGLQGYDVMALELIQNADDAKAESISFDITDHGLYILNSGKFSYCGDLKHKPCGFNKSQNTTCDFHRIADVGSGVKLNNSDNIGRFGIGFVSTYQVTDHPEIISSGVKLTLYPEEGEWQIAPYKESEGTTFFLKWADDSNSQARLALGLSHISPSHIKQLIEDFKKTLRNSLLFLKHINKAEIRRNGELILACDLDRGSGSDLIVSFRPTGEVEEWHILQADASTSALPLYESYPRLKSFSRSTKVSIALRIDPKPLKSGLLYAFLPTEQSIEVPLHINADFFPEADRKSIILNGNQHESAWNEMLLEVAATELARDLVSLMQTIGEANLWQILSSALQMSTLPNYPNCFKLFWDKLKESATKSHIVRVSDGSFYIPENVYLTNKLDIAQINTLQQMGAVVPVEDLRKFRNILIQFGTPILTFERLVNLLEETLANTLIEKVEIKKFTDFYQPIWKTINELMPDKNSLQGSPKEIYQQLSEIPILVTENFYPIKISQAYLLPLQFKYHEINTLLPNLQIANRYIHEFEKFKDLIAPLNLERVFKHIQETNQSLPINEVISTSEKDLIALYKIFAELDLLDNADITTYEGLKMLPIWLTTTGLNTAKNVLMPGNFNDPTGEANLLDMSGLNNSVKEFFSAKLTIKTLTLKAYILDVLSNFFNEGRDINLHKYNSLMIELASHQNILDDSEIIQKLKSIKIAPTMDGGWNLPKNIYRKTDVLVKILGDGNHHWLDINRLPNKISVNNFIDSLEILKSPIPNHLVNRIISISNHNKPTEEAIKHSSEAFYVLCEKYDQWKDLDTFNDAINNLRNEKCFPAEGDSENWYESRSLYTPYRAAAFRSQVNVLGFANQSRLKKEVLEKLGITWTPNTAIVINHLKNFIKNGTQPTLTTYEVLNERAKEKDTLVATLKTVNCIYFEKKKIFLSPNECFWTSQKLGRFAYTLPEDYKNLTFFFDCIGVKQKPDGKDLIDIVIKIVKECYEKQIQLIGVDRGVYEFCLKEIAELDKHNEIVAEDFQRLQKTPMILNLSGQLQFPDEVLLKDSEWLVSFFNSELDCALTKQTPELLTFIEKLGVKKLSESAKLVLDSFEGLPEELHEITATLKERIDVIERYMHDKTVAIRQRMRNALSGLSTVSYDHLKIEASVKINDRWVYAPPINATSFFDKVEKKLILRRPILVNNWPGILNAIFHQLMPEESGNEIAKLNLSLGPMMSISVSQAHQNLTDSGIPPLESEIGDFQMGDLTSDNIDNIGTYSESELIDQEASTKASLSLPIIGKRIIDPIENSPFSNNHKHNLSSFQPSSQTQKIIDSTFSKEKERQANDDVNVSQATANLFDDDNPVRKTRPKHKSQWDIVLRSYVKPKSEISEHQNELDNNQHNLAVESIAREAVCQYEKERGRDPEEMALNQPGYDIISRNPRSDSKRYIEVKGVSGEWNNTGVGLSSLQFNHSLKYGNQYWLYVVEFVSDPKCIHVYPICNPSAKVTKFMFDGNWRYTVIDESPDPKRALKKGAKIEHTELGLGVIDAIELKGSSFFIWVNFTNKGLRGLAYNETVMKIIK
ncbi:DUF3883 domain-containing protein [Polynucleobacter kasalickyi]|uniref:Uncharacterized protein n=1 Tax=Polynucleobacter kasalickyi TaxID=1938817 RepID=A0A1W2BL49_9BURK|nr:DUF3883 domain-containing protein [Polynucleobacter kasalickyi]SMC73687.1 protein of unknown function [Polynucleobacter kasalickyi]